MYHKEALKPVKFAHCFITAFNTCMPCDITMGNIAILSQLEQSVNVNISAIFAYFAITQYCGWLYFCGYMCQFSLTERKQHILRVQNLWPSYYTPLKQSLEGYIGITLSVCSSVCLSVRLFTSCPDHYFLPPCRIWIIFHTIIVHDPRMCHDLDTRSYLQGQGHSAHIPKIRVWAITPHCYGGSGSYFTQLLSMTQGCVMTLTQGHTFKVKVKCTYTIKMCVRTITLHCRVGSK